MFRLYSPLILIWESILAWFALLPYTIDKNSHKLFATVLLNHWYIIFLLYQQLDCHSKNIIIIIIRTNIRILIIINITIIISIAIIIRLK